MAELYASISEKKYFNLTELASLCNVTPAAALFWCRQGRVKVHDRTSLRGKYRITRKEVIRILGQRRVEVPGLWSPRRRILVIDEFAPIAKLIRALLEHAGIPVDVRGARSVGDGLMLAGKMEPELIFVDYGFPVGKLQGRQAIAALREASALKSAKIVGMGSLLGCEREMRDAGAVEFLCKPFGSDQVMPIALRLLKIRDPRKTSKLARETPCRSSGSVGVLGSRR